MVEHLIYFGETAVQGQYDQPPWLTLGASIFTNPIKSEPANKYTRDSDGHQFSPDACTKAVSSTASGLSPVWEAVQAPEVEELCFDGLF